MTAPARAALAVLRAVAITATAVVAGSLSHVAAHGELTSVHKALEHLTADLHGPSMLAASHACVGLLVALLLAADTRGVRLALPRLVRPGPVVGAPAPRPALASGELRPLARLLVASGVTGRGPPHSFC